MIPTNKKQEILDFIHTIEQKQKPGNVKKHPTFLLIKELTSFLPEDTFVHHRFYHIKNELWSIPLCKCGTPLTWRKDFKSYNTYCSSRCSAKDPEVRNKTKNTNIVRYGSTSPLSNSVVKEKIQKTIQSKYGVDNPSQSEDIKLKKQQTSIKKFGTLYPTQTTEVQNKKRETNLARYGHINVLASQSVQQHTKDLLFLKYKRYSPNQRHISELSLSKLNNREWLYNEHVVLKKPLTQIAEELSVNDTTVGKYLHQHGYETQSFIRSKGEQEVCDFLEKNGIVVIQNSRNIISPFELDIFLPEYQIAIEYCGIYWHSEQLGKDKNYHKNKLDQCNKIGIRLITLFSDEWETKNLLVREKLLNILKQSKQESVFARKCSVELITTQQRDLFLERYHIQGSSSGSVNLGLIFNQKLIACMVLIQQTPRHFILNRYSTSVNVPGGFSKLLKYFTNNYSWNTITSFSDNRWSMGRLYDMNNFFKDKELEPDYSYSIDRVSRIHKFNFRRKYLPSILEDFDPALSEQQNCDNNNVLRIWDCGKIRWIKYNQPNKK